MCATENVYYNRFLCLRSSYSSGETNWDSRHFIDADEGSVNKDPPDAYKYHITQMALRG